MFLLLPTFQRQPSVKTERTLIIPLHVDEGFEPNYASMKVKWEKYFALYN